MDTGASASFINPEYVLPREQLECKPVTITTVFKSYLINKQVSLPTFSEFNQSGTLKFLIFKFHNFFDGLLGIDSLISLGAKIDLVTRAITTNNAINNINFKTNQSTGILQAPANAKTMLKLPINKTNGTIYINSIELNPTLFISPGLYNVNNGYSFVEITNFSNNAQTFLLESPLAAEQYDEMNFIELNNFDTGYNNNFEDDNNQHHPQSLDTLLRTDHLNIEEHKQLLKICKTYSDLIYKEGDPLSFTLRSNTT